MKTKNIISLDREACLSLSSQVHCGKIQCKHGCPPSALWEKTEKIIMKPPTATSNRMRGSRTKASASVVATHWLHTELTSRDPLEYRPGTVRTLGTPTTFWTRSEWEKMLTLGKYYLWWSERNAPSSALPAFALSSQFLLKTSFTIKSYNC